VHRGSLRPSDRGLRVRGGFAYLGARVIYGLGREVAAAREMGSYRLEEKLGQGGMGEVWRARHRHLARPAAIKLIRPSLVGDPRPGAADDLRRRFEREAQTIAGLRSPHTVDLYDFGVTDDGAFYCVMEAPEGLDADTLVKRFGPLPAERVLHVLRQVCHSLSEADSRGLVHRDIKPANIFLCRYGEEHDFVKVLDFGLVKSLDEGAGATRAPRLTRENTVPGTRRSSRPSRRWDARAGRTRGPLRHGLRGVLAADGPDGVPGGHADGAADEARERAGGRTVRADGDSRSSRAGSGRAGLSGEGSARPAAIGAGALRRLAQIRTERPWTEERAREWWTNHRP